MGMLILGRVIIFDSMEITTIFMSSGTAVLGYYYLVTEKKMMIIRVGRFLGREVDHKFTINEMLWNRKWKRLVCSLTGNEKKVVLSVTLKDECFLFIFFFLKILYNSF